MAIKINPRNIAEGWFNVFLDKLSILDPEIKKISTERMSICMACPVRTNNRCDNTKSHINNQGQTFSGCGCDITAKSLSMASGCPGNFWTPKTDI